jgi:predicted ATPase
MRVVFVHSWRLLTSTEQAMLARLAIFVGGFDLDATRAAADATPLLLASLVDKSLIQCSGEGRSMTPNEIDASLTAELVKPMEAF